MESGKIRYWGVSNLDPSDMRELTELSGFCQTDRILYNLSRRGSTPGPSRSWPTPPVEQGRLLRSPALASVARRHNAIPKAATLAHVRENALALEIRLADEDLAGLDAAFPPPDGPEPLDVL